MVANSHREKRWQPLMSQAGQEIMISQYSKTAMRIGRSAAQLSTGDRYSQASTDFQLGNVAKE